MRNNIHREITLKDPERWHLTFSKKRKHYFQFHSSWWSDNDFCRLLNGSKTLLCWLLTQFLSSNKATVSICLDSACMVLNISLDEAKEFLSELESNDFIDMPQRVRKSKKSPIEENKRKENRIEAKSEINFVDDSVDECVSYIEKLTKSAPAKNTKTASPKKKTNKEKIYDELLELWNRNAPDYNMPVINQITGKRKKALDVALKEFPKVDDWKRIFSSATTKFFTKPDGSEFVPSWDYCFRNERYRQLYEEFEILFGDQKKSNEKTVRNVEKILYSQL